MSKVIRELSDEEVWRLGLDDFPYVEEEFENIKNDDNVIGMAIPKDDNKIIKFPISSDESLSKRKINTVIKNVRKLSKLEGNAVVAKSVDGKIVYIINYKNKDGRKYILLEEDLLRHLADTTSSNEIKVYLLLQYRSSEIKETKITRKSLAIGIGLNGNSGENLLSISNMLIDLKDKSLIEVNKKYINVKLENGNFKNTECLFIKLKSYEEWKKHHNEK